MGGTICWSIVIACRSMSIVNYGLLLDGSQLLKSKHNLALIILALSLHVETIVGLLVAPVSFGIKDILRIWQM